MSKTVDQLDMKILKALSEDSRKSNTAIAKEVGASRPTIIARIDKLIENKIVDVGAKVNVTKLGFKLVNVHFQMDQKESEQELVERISACPRVLQLFESVGKRNFTAIIFVENADSIISVIECFRNALHARVSSWHRVRPLIGETFNMKINVEKCAKTPCGKVCGLCLSYQQLECIGCPTSKDYKGPI